jgi:Flp pilus assembly protein TadB
VSSGGHARFSVICTRFIVLVAFATKFSTGGHRPRRQSTSVLLCLQQKQAQQGRMVLSFRRLKAPTTKTDLTIAESNRSGLMWHIRRIYLALPSVSLFLFCQCLLQSPYLIDLTCIHVVRYQLPTMQSLRQKASHQPILTNSSRTESNGDSLK